MNQKTFEQSKKDGGHQFLASLAGEWQGMTKTWFEPDKLADESQTRATFRLVLDGRFVMQEYEGTLMGKKIQGIAIWGNHLQTGIFQRIWIDNFHMGTGMMLSEGSRIEHGINVIGSYHDSAGGQDWGWRTQLELAEPDTIVVTAFNISPEGHEAKAIETRYERVK
ncbi:MAG: DUF1579 domain-containing protein [Deferribacteres bacterium]|nr:DUF1579 domain-containing protein [candidate division KSB1 bacterium]MCB9512157.1 DUF1579 domain-containing protein [Deferribacteres bacterium]